VARVVFKPTTGQVVYFLALTAVATALPIGVYFWVPGRYAESRLIGVVLVFVFLTAPVILWCLRRSIGRTVLTDAGAATTGTLLVRRSVAWADVTAVRTGTDASRGSSTTRYIVLDRARGRVRLAAPYTNTFNALRDEEFESKLDQVRDLWTLATAKVSEH